MKYTILLLGGFSFIWLIRPADLGQPFIFNPYTLQIYTGSMDENFQGPFAKACPFDPEIITENNINEKNTLDRKGLLVREFYRFKTIQEVGGCKNDYQLAAAFRNDGTLEVIEFGLEIYFEYDKLPEDINTASYEEHVPISYARSILKQGAHHYGLTSLFSSYEKSLEFIWIKKIGIRYDVFRWDIIQLKYNIHRNTDQQLKAVCQDHSLGITFYSKKHGPFDGFYSTVNQKNIFSLVQLPEGNGCQSTYECVKKYDILMPYHFEPFSDASISCSNLTTIPIWHERVEELDNLEKFLIAVGQVTENKLLIVTGVHDVLSFPKKNSRKPKSMPMYLYPKRKRIPIPRIFYKIVRYQTHKCDERKALCWFELIILIHNQPTFTKEERLCHKDKCREWGWEQIKFTRTSAKEGNGSEHIYCCEWNRELEKILGYKRSKEINQNLNLNDFPVYNKEKNDHDYVNKKELVQIKMKQFQKDDVTL